MRTAGLRAGRAATAACALLAAALPGCVERKLIVRSDPPGAVVSLEDAVLEARTPVTVPATWDGIRRVTLHAPGHRVLETTAEIPARWYDYFPLDVFAEFLWPWTIREVVTYEFDLEPYQPEEQHFSEAQLAEMRERLKELTARGEEYRAGGSEGPGKAASAPTTTPATDEPPPPPAPRDPASASPVR